MSPQEEPEGPEDEEVDLELEERIREWWATQQDQYWESFDEIARRNPYYGPYQPLVVVPTTEEEDRAYYFELKRLTKLRQESIEPKDSVDETGITQGAPPRED